MSNYMDEKIKSQEYSNANNRINHSDGKIGELIKNKSRMESQT